MFAKLFPETALKRAKAKIQLKALNDISSTGNNFGYGANGASKNKNSLIGWLNRSADADTDIVANLDILRQRSRDLYMGSGLANGALKTIVTNVVGSGLHLNSQIDYEYLQITKEEANAIERDIEREFALWADNSYCCDVASSNNFYELQALALLSMLMNGDSFVLLPVVKRKNSVYDLKINLIEADRVCNPIPCQSVTILEGIEVDNFGLPRVYYIANRHPNAHNITTPLKHESIPAFGAKTGRRNVLHLYTSERSMQRRGLPILAPVMEMFKQLSRYSDAEIAAAVVSGMFSVFVKTQTPQAPFGMDSKLVNNGSTYELASGMIIPLAENESIETANPSRPNTSFDGFVMSILRQIGSSLELPYELLIKHFTASYSASRGSILQAWQMFRTRRYWLVNNFCKPIYAEWLNEAVAKNRLNLPNFFADERIRQAYLKADFFGNSMPQIDPLKEVKAATERVRQGFSTRAKEAAELSGLNFDELAKVRIAEEELVDKFRRDEKYIGVSTNEEILANKESE
ncbi:MAG TPA: phage portal protein [Burkholderiales bacterium]|nr:phage portal protein [Burkholderiales bacterium]